MVMYVDDGRGWDTRINSCRMKSRREIKKDGEWQAKLSRVNWSALHEQTHTRQENALREKEHEKDERRKWT